MERGPHILYSSTTFQRGYKIFRTLGLSHLFIINSKNSLVGIITRSELLPEHIAKCELSIIHDEMIIEEENGNGYDNDYNNINNSNNSNNNNNNNINNMEDGTIYGYNNNKNKKMNK